jgi:hypothetical protein
MLRLVVLLAMFVPLILDRPLPNPDRPAGSVPLLYARLEAQQSTFFTQRNLMRDSHELDGGGAIATGVMLQPNRVRMIAL